MDVELLAPAAGASNIKSIVMTNIHGSADATIKLTLQKYDGSSSFVLFQTSLPAGVTLILDDRSMLSFDNVTTTGYGLYCNVGASDTVDLIINL